MNAYIYNADIYCEGCGNAIKRDLDEAFRTNEVKPADQDTDDSERYPQGPYSDGGGEADTPCHCAACEAFLENPLTGDGEDYVRAAWEENAGSPIVQQWAQYYDYLGLIGDEHAGAAS